MENRNIDWIILAFLREEATTNEVEILRKWISDDKEHQNIFESVKLYWENSMPGVKSSDTEKAYSRLMSKSFRGYSEGVININTNNRSIKFPWYRIAVALILFFTLAGSVYFIFSSNQPVPEILVSTEIIKQNPKGQKLTTYLPDGSKVILNSLSRIKYSAPFVGNERVVELMGEAFFEVEKDVDKPFKVIANGVTTTALGTSFNVNSKNNDFVEVVLISGKVEVTHVSMKPVTLNPGKSAKFSQNGEIKIQEFDYLEKVGWKDGVLAFDDNSLSEIINKLEDWYGVDFKVKAMPKDQFHYTGNYKNGTLKEVLQGISFVHQFEYKISGHIVEIYF